MITLREIMSAWAVEREPFVTMVPLRVYSTSSDPIVDKLRSLPGPYRCSLIERPPEGSKPPGETWVGLGPGHEIYDWRAVVNEIFGMLAWARLKCLQYRFAIAIHYRDDGIIAFATGEQADDVISWTSQGTTTTVPSVGAN
jgi:hypothetical protein